MYKIDDYSEGEIQRPEDAAGVCDVEQSEKSDRKELSAVVGNAEDLISLCESTHRLESERHRLLDATHANEKIQTAAQNINVMDNDVTMCSGKNSASAGEENSTMRLSVENPTRDLHPSVAAVADAAASARAFDQESIELLEQRGCLQDEVFQLSKHETSVIANSTYLNDNRPNTIDLSIEEFRIILNEDRLETENSSTFSSGRSTVNNDTCLPKIAGVVDFESQQPPILDSIASSSLSVVSSGSGTNSIVLNEVETVASLKVQLKRAQRGLIALTSKRVTSTNRLLEISALQDELEESETKRRDNENALRTVRKELLTAQWKLSEALDSAERNINQDQELELEENALLNFKMVVREKEVEQIQMMCKYCKYTKPSIDMICCSLHKIFHTFRRLFVD